MPSVVRDVHVENLLAGRRYLIDWTLNDISEGVTAYEIWRSNTEFGAVNFSKIAEVQSPTNQFVDKVAFTFGVNFFYKVLARNAAGLRSDINLSSAVSDTTFDDFEEAPFGALSLQTGSIIVGEVPAGLVNGINTVFTLANLFRFNTIAVFVNGLNLVRNTAFTENTDQLTITLTAAPTIGSTIVVNYIKV